MNKNAAVDSFFEEKDSARKIFKRPSQRQPEAPDEPGSGLTSAAKELISIIRDYAEKLPEIVKQDSELASRILDLVKELRSRDKHVVLRTLREVGLEKNPLVYGSKKEK